VVSKASSILRGNLGSNPFAPPFEANITSITGRPALALRV
jgi:hypothetical protein